MKKMIFSCNSKDKGGVVKGSISPVSVFGLPCLDPKHLLQCQKHSALTADSVFSSSAWSEEMVTIPGELRTIKL